ncbi:MAG: hypothetical protein HC852_04935 [Acaryochloridaceae cyanobacterium RU_4_10]|nr:hypothetical protein [Acaryochloridaceae cyanobacterium RU_4_10]
MTTEVAILNKSAVALAADSAVTISHGINGEKKIYNSVNKLFSLSKHHPIGIMVYDNANIMDVPWETLIKSYRKKLGSQSKSLLKEYVDDFLKFIKNDFFNEEIEQQYIERIIIEQLVYLKSTISNLVNQEINDSGEISENKTKEIIKSIIDPFHNKILHEKTIENIAQDDFVKIFLSRYKTLIDKLIDNILEKLPLTKNDRKKLMEIPALFFCKEIFIYKTGVVIAGFGEDEIYPSLHSLIIECSILKNLKLKREEGACVKTEGACIMPFAQDSTIRTFVDGIDPSLEKFSKQHIESIFSQYTDLIIKLIPEQNNSIQLELKEKIREINKLIIDRYDEEVLEFKMVNHIDPIISAVQFLPKDELAAMAEALVNITSLRKRISITPETVGGPVDVAIILKEMVLYGSKENTTLMKI